MESFFARERGNPGVSKALLGAVAAAVILVSAFVVSVFLIPSAEQKDKEILEGAYREGSPEFSSYKKEIIITNDPNRMQEARTGLGDVIMKLSGRIRNRGDRTLTGLEVSVGMIDTRNRLIRDRKILFIPKHYPELSPRETIDVSVSISGFAAGDDRANARWQVTAIKFKE